jgi:PAS domain S-box-containing protein
MRPIRHGMGCPVFAPSIRIGVIKCSLLANLRKKGQYRVVNNRRRQTQSVESPISVLEQLPARVVLERIPVPVVAIGQDGSILFANAAFAEMLGYSTETVLTLRFIEIFHTPPLDASPVSAVRGYANEIVALLHADGSIVKAKMSKSALMRENDPLALATFEDLTEQLWVRGRR